MTAEYLDGPQVYVNSNTFTGFELCERMYKMGIRPDTYTISFEEIEDLTVSDFLEEFIEAIDDVDFSDYNDEDELECLIGDVKAGLYMISDIIPIDPAFSGDVLAIGNSLLETGYDKKKILIKLLDYFDGCVAANDNKEGIMRNDELDIGFILFKKLVETRYFCNDGNIERYTSLYLENMKTRLANANDSYYGKNPGRRLDRAAQELRKIKSIIDIHESDGVKGIDDRLVTMLEEFTKIAQKEYNAFNIQKEHVKKLSGGFTNISMDHMNQMLQDSGCVVMVGNDPIDMKNGLTINGKPVTGPVYITNNFDNRKVEMKDSVVVRSSINGPSEFEKLRGDINKDA
jgi:hypothetical protein